MIQSIDTAVPLARARMGRAQWEFLASCKSEEDYNTFMYLSEEALEELEYWENLPEGLSLPITLASSRQSVDTDASKTGIGIYFNGELISEPVPDGHINEMELFALMWVFDLCNDRLEPGVLTWRVDKNPALFAIRNHGTMRSWNLSWFAMQIVEKAHSMGITIAPI